MSLTAAKGASVVVLPGFSMCRGPGHFVQLRGDNQLELMTSKAREWMRGDNSIRQICKFRRWVLRQRRAVRLL